MSTLKINDKSFTNSLRTAATKVDDNARDAMLSSIAVALIERNAFETRDGTVESGDAWFNTHKRITTNADSVARLFVVSNVTDARNVICRKLSSRSMFNAYALDKMVEIANLVCGRSTKMQTVSKAFIACAIVATDNGMTILDNATNALFLKHGGTTSAQVRDDDVRDKLNGFARTMCGNSEQTQSSQMRCVLEALGFVTIVNDTRSRGAIKVDVKSPFMRLFRSTYMFDVVTKVEPRATVDA